MAITVHIPTALRRFGDGAESCTLQAASLEELFAQLEARFPAMKPHLRDSSGQIRHFLNVYVNEEDIRFLGGPNYRFQDGDEVLLVPAIAGGAPSASIVVPATTANLGCAFDCAAVALNLYLRASATRKSTGGFQVRYGGVDADRIPPEKDNLVVKGMQRLAAWANVDLGGAGIELENEIPIGVGLGSSAAAIVAGTLLGAELCGLKLEGSAVLLRALEIEGHPDNISAAYHGGMVVAATTEDPGDVLVCRTDVSPELDFVAVVPDVPLPTEQARSALPREYCREDVVQNLQRTALLAACFFSGRIPSPEVFRDRLHQPYRSPLVPGISECLAFRHEGLVGVFLSGAGSGIMAIAQHSAAQIGEALVEEFRRRGVTARAILLKAENRGARIPQP
jgi:homoserine kinase